MSSQFVLKLFPHDPAQPTSALGLQVSGFVTKSNYFLTTLLNQLLLLVCKFLVLSPSRPASIAFRSLINSKFSALSGSLDRVALLLGVLDAGPRDGTAPCLCGRTKQQNPAIANIYWDKNTRASWPRTASLPSANGIIPIGDTR